MKKVFFTILVFILGIALGFGIMYVVNDDSKSSTKEENNNLNEEVEITDNLLKEDLTKKISDISNVYGGADFSDNLIKIYGPSFREDLYNNLTLTDDQKMEKVLFLAKIYDDNINNKENNNIKDDSLADEAILGLVKQSDVENLYSKYFGTNKVNHRSMTLCHYYHYDESNHVYYVYERGCGGSGPAANYLYMNKFSTKGDEAYVYLNAFLIYENLDGNSYSTYTIYKDINSKEVYKTITEEELASFKVDSTNADSFDQYKFTFEKDTNGNYYFKSISKVN